MKLNRQIAFIAVLLASVVMFVHAVVPHHHRASDLVMCTVETESCSHSDYEVNLEMDVDILGYEADCNSCNCNGIKCAPTLPFMLRCGGSAEAEERSCIGDDAELLPLILVGITDTGDCLVSNLLSGNLYPRDGVVILSEYILESLSRRGPPVA